MACLDKTAADPAAGQGRQAEDQGRFGSHLATPQVGAQVAQGHQGDHQQRKGYGLPHRKGCAADQQGHQQDRAAGTEYGEQKTDQGPTRTQQQHQRDDHLATLVQFMGTDGAFMLRLLPPAGSRQMPTYSARRANWPRVSGPP